MTDATTRLSTTLADRYVIERLLGEGGMATVYLAQDRKHGRKVALKVLKPEIAEALGAERFEQEIRIAARLSHPHILAMHDSGAAEGSLYYVMPYVEDESLRDRLQRERQLPVDETVRLAKQVASALDYAHRQGVVHRDIKPENILIHDGEAMVADFGIALAIEEAGASRLTQSGLSLGTPQYMSPEQARGDSAIDARSDVHALGALVFELLTGESPFASSSAQATIARLLTEPPPSPTAIRHTVPKPLETAVVKALAKLPADRFPIAAAFAEALEAPDGGSTNAGPTAIVVLPFVNRSGDPENEYFSDGLTEEIISDLAKIRSLRVISRNSAMQLKGTSKSTPAIASELGVTHVVSGSVRRAGEALRVTAELVEAAPDATIWSDKFSGTMADVFGIQEEIAQKIVGALEVELTDTEARQVAERPIDDPVAYDCYLRARREIYRWTAQSIDRANRLVDDALAIVGDNPLLLAMKGQIAWMNVNASIRPDERYLDQAADLATRALTLDPDHHLGIFVRGVLAGQRGEIERALQDLRRAHELRPGDANVLGVMCRWMNSAGVGHGAYMDELLRIDPLVQRTYLAVAFFHHMSGRYEEAVPGARRAIELADTTSNLQILAAWTLAAAGQRAEARTLLEQAGRELGDTRGMLARFLRHAFDGAADRAFAEITPELERAMALADYQALAMAEGHASLGRADDAVRWLRLAAGRGFINYPYISRHSPFLAELRKDRGFIQLMDEVKPRWEALVEAEADAERAASGSTPNSSRPSSTPSA